MSSASKDQAAQRSLPPPDRRPNPYERIKQAILSGELAPGQALVEGVLAEWCEVSRTPVREALTRLEQDGLIGRGDRGLVVHESSPGEILDIYETRIILETAAARFAADRRNPNDLLMMRRQLPRMEKLSDAEPAVKAAMNAEFHELVWRASHNRSLLDLLGRLSMHLGRYPATTLAYPGRWESGNTEHRALVDAIEARNSDLAAQIASQHFSTAREIRLKLWETD